MPLGHRRKAWTGNLDCNRCCLLSMQWCVSCYLGQPIALMVECFPLDPNSHYIMQYWVLCFGSPLFAARPQIFALMFSPSAPPPPPPLIYSTLFSSPLSLPPFPHLSKFWAIDMLNTYSEIYTCRSVPVICISHCFLFLAGQCIFIFLPPKYHILMKFCCHTTSTAISIATDNWKLLSLINSFLHA